MEYRSKTLVYQKLYTELKEYFTGIYILGIPEAVYENRMYIRGSTVPGTAE